MKEKDEARLDRLAYASTKGQALKSDEQQWLADMYRASPAEYTRVQSAASARARAEVNPFK